MLQHIHPFMQECDEDDALRIRQIENQVTLASIDTQFFVNLRQGLAEQWLRGQCVASLLYCVEIDLRLMFSPGLNRVSPDAL